MFVPQAVTQSVYVPLQHWAYDYIERLETKGVITGALNGTRPFSREEFTRYLMQVDEKVRAGYHLTNVEQQQLDFLHFEFKEEFELLSGHNGVHYQSNIEKLKHSKTFGKLFPGFLYKNNRNLFHLDKDAFRVNFDPVFYHDWLYAGADSLSGAERVLERAHGLTLWGQLGTHVGFYFDFRDTKQWGTRTYPRQFDISLPGLGFVNGYGTHIWHDETVAYVVFKLPYFQLIVGKDRNYWGPGFNGALGLSDNATSYDQIKLQSKFWRLKFTWLWGFLRTFPAILDEAGRAREKNLIAHRLEVDVARWLNLGLYEAVIFSNRRFELAYVNPINFYRSAEHALGDDDNVSMGLDFELLLIPNVKLYGELFIDDLFTSRLGSGYFGNKTAYLAGAYWVDAFAMPNLDARMEYVRTRPFVYTHKTGINAYSHFSTGLGHWIGPNADDWLFHLRYRLSKSWLISLQVEFYRHGANEPENNVGGDFRRARASGDADIVPFLSGIEERRKRLAFNIRYEIFRNFFVGVDLNTASSENMLLPDGQRGGVGRREVLFGVSLNR
ncbi:MAG: capsule assembly Wzi family protein [bacterium]